MPNRRNIRPDILKVDALRIHRISVAAVVLNVAATVSAYLDWRANASERFWLPLCVVQQAIVARVQSPGNRETSGHLNCDPVAEVHAELGEVRAEQYVPLGKIVKFSPYSLPRLNGGSAKTVSTTSSRIWGSTAMQSPANSAPNDEVYAGAIGDAGLRYASATNMVSSYFSAACLDKTSFLRNHNNLK